MEFTPEQIEAISSSVADKLKTQRSNRVVSNEEHNDHHIFIKQFKARVELDDKAKRKIVEGSKLWAVILFLGFTATIAATAFWDYFIKAIEKAAGS